MTGRDVEPKRETGTDEGEGKGSVGRRNRVFEGESQTKGPFGWTLLKGVSPPSQKVTHTPGSIFRVGDCGEDVAVDLFFTGVQVSRLRSPTGHIFPVILEKDVTRKRFS